MDVKITECWSSGEKVTNGENKYDRCLQTLEKPAKRNSKSCHRKQTLKLDLFLLIDLNELARNLDALDQNLMTRRQRW